jgi:hypothetical protein
LAETGAEDVMRERWLSVEKIDADPEVHPGPIHKCFERNKLPTQRVGRPWRVIAGKADESVRAMNVTEEGHHD